MIAYAAFLSLGLFEGVIGVAWPSIRDEFSVGNESFGVLLIALTCGHATASFSSGWLISRLGIALPLMLSLALTSGGVMLQGSATGWLFIVGASSVLGLGMGVLDSGMNTYAARHYRPRLLNWLHASFAAGAVAGSFIMTTVISSDLSWRVGMFIVASWHAIIFALLWITRRHWTMKSGDAPTTRFDNGVDESLTGVRREELRSSNGSTLLLPSVIVSIALFFVYTGIVATVGKWGFALLSESRLIPTKTAGLWITFFWTSFFAGRVLLGFIETNLNVLIRLSLLGTFICSLVFVSPNVEPAFQLACIVLIGFAMAPVFPVLIALSPKRFGSLHSSNAIGFQIGAAGIGAAAVPSLAGWLSQYFGLEVITLVLAVGSATVLVLHELLDRQTKAPQY